MRILLLSTADTDLLAARASAADYRLANPTRVDVDAVPALLDGVDLAVVRLLGGRQAWPDGLAAVLALRRAHDRARRRGGARRGADGDLHGGRPGWSPRRWRYLVEGGRGQPGASWPGSCPTRCCSPARASTRPHPPRRTASSTKRAAGPAGPQVDGDGRPTVGIVFYRAHALAGNTEFVTDPGRRGRRGRRQPAARLLRLAARAQPRRRAAGALRPLRRPRRHRARRRRDGRRRRLRRRRRGRLGRRRARRPGRPGDPGALPDQHPRAVGRERRRRSPRWTRRCRWPSPSSTAGSSPCRSRSRRSTPTGCRSTPPTPSGPPGSPGSPSGTPGCDTLPERRQAARDRAQLLPDQALPGRQRRRPGHPRLGGTAARRAAPTPATTSATRHRPTTATR